ncbi:MAG: GTPase Era [Gammaproteobacteria bacterium]
MSEDTSIDSFRCGFVALVGRPNVGKSTLLNRILGQKISITSRRPQTTRHRILGIKTESDSQVIYVDTPGLHRKASRAINRYMNRTAGDVLQDVDVVVFVVEGTRWTNDDDLVLQRLREVRVPVILAVNKVDRVQDKTVLLPHLQALGEKFTFEHIIPISAERGENVPVLERAVTDLLPQAPPMFPPDQITDRSERFLAAELVREKLFRHLGQELPYGLTVEIERFREERDMLHINALVWVERDSQKSIVIGKGGALLKQVGRDARLDMETAFGRKVFLEIWVKVKEGWADDERALRSLGYHD